MIKTGITETILNFLREDLITNLNIIGVIENEPDAQIYVDNTQSPGGVFVRYEYFNYLYTKKDEFIEDVLREFFSVPGWYGFSGLERSIAEKIRHRYETDWESRCALYYLPKGNLNLKLIKNETCSIDIKDAEIVNKYYQYSHEGSLDVIKNDILQRPSSAIYVNGEIVCWVLVHDDNSMGIMYTREDYRKKGYAVDVTVSLSSKIIERGKMPFVHINENNNMSPGLALKCGFVKYGYADWFGIIVGTPQHHILEK